MTIISLAGRLPGRSSSLPESRSGPGRPCSLIWPCSRWGLPSQPVARLLVGSYIKEPKLPHLFTLASKPVLKAVYFLLHFPGSSAIGRANRLERWALPTTVSCGARTFLSPQS